MSNTLTLQVQGMSCGHCKMSVEKAVKKLPGVQSVEATPAENRVQITHDGTGSLEAIKEAIMNEGYVVVD